MQVFIEIHNNNYTAVREYLLRNRLEQAAFLFASCVQDAAELRLRVSDFYLVPEAGWEVQEELYLQMSDSERSKIMHRARDASLAVIDCHSHPSSGEDVWFSSSDRRGIAEFAQYAKWKVPGQPYVAMVFGRASVDAVAWYGDFVAPQRVAAVRVLNGEINNIRPTNSWFRETGVRRPRHPLR